MVKYYFNREENDYLLKKIYYFGLQDVLSRPADEFGNDETVETLWAMRAYEHAEIYFNVSVNKIKSRSLKIFIGFVDFSCCVVWIHVH